MKDYTYFISVCLLSIAVCFIISVNHNHHERINELSSSLNKLIKIEILSQTQFNILADKIDKLEKKNNPKIVQNP